MCVAPAGRRCGECCREGDAPLEGAAVLAGRWTIQEVLGRAAADSLVELNGRILEGACDSTPSG